ncbi:hypothetical protein GQ457_09G027630 [Hibiscus cannabinus]
MAFFDFFWTIWLCRNESVFNQKNWEVNAIFDLAFTKIGFWCKSCWPDIPYSISDFISNLNYCRVPTSRRIRPAQGVWVKPPPGFLKF